MKYVDVYSAETGKLLCARAEVAMTFWGGDVLVRHQDVSPCKLIWFDRGKYVTATGNYH